MRIIILALLGGATLVTIASAGIKLNSSAAAATATDALKNPSIERFLLQASGNDATCIVEKAEGVGPMAHMVVAAGCDEMLPGLSRLHYWSEAADGTVTLSADGTTPSVVFAQADGVAYESIEPRAPLMSLLESD